MLEHQDLLLHRQDLRCDLVGRSLDLAVDLSDLIVVADVVGDALLRLGELVLHSLLQLDLEVHSSF